MKKLLHFRDIVPKPADSAIHESTEPIILFVIRLFDNVILMPEMTVLIQKFYSIN
jgi:hypothetical protein